jgi:restriction endonuclease, S subunit
MSKMFLGDVCLPESSNIAQKDLTDKDGQYPIYGASGLISHVNFYRQECEYIAVVKDGAGIGRVFLLPPYSSVIGTMQYILPKPNIDVHYLYFAMQFMNLAKYYSGSTIPHIYFKNYKHEPIKLPPLEKQREIADTLETIKQTEDNLNEQITHLDELVKSQFVELFGDPVTNPMGWERARLADKCEIVTGNTPSRKVKEYYGNDLEWIKSDNITEATTLTEATEYLSDEGAKVGRTVETGSILMTCIAGSLRSIGNVAIVDRKVAFNQQINAIVPKKQNTYFMYEQFRLSKDYICSGVNMALKGILSKGQLSEIEFVFPPLALQNEFAAFVEQTDKSKLVLHELLEKQKTLKASLMQEYFS